MGTIDVGPFQRTVSSAGGRVSADRKSLPDLWVGLCHKHGFVKMSWTVKLPIELVYGFHS